MIVRILGSLDVGMVPVWGRWDRAACWALALSLAAGLLLSSAAAAQTSDNGVSKEIPNIGPVAAAEPASAKDCTAIDFSTAELARAHDRVLLRITGEAPHAGMSIEVRPVLYVMQPDYWQMALVACGPKGVKADGPPVTYSAEINVSGSVGRKGVVLSGTPGAKTKRLELPN